MSDSSENGGKPTSRFRSLLQKARLTGSGRAERIKKWRTAVRSKAAAGSSLKFDPRKIEFRGVTEHPEWFRWGLLVLGVFLLAELTSRAIGLFIRPVFTSPPRASVAHSGNSYAANSDYDAITRRNMFNVEGKIPDPFDQGLLDCFSQARPSTQRMVLLGTIVMGDPKHSVALIQEESNGLKVAVKKDEVFGDGKFTALQVERRRFCFQVRNGELEFIDTPEEGGGGLTASLAGGSEGIVPTSENSYAVKKDFLNDKLLNLTDILQTAKAVPYLEPGSGKFMGFLVQSVDPGSPFSQLGIRQGDILTTVNDIVLDNPGKGLEAFQKLRNSPKVTLGIVRGGEKNSISYDIR